MTSNRQGANGHYQAVIDMGSNGIRFSITDLSPPTARTLTTIFADRCAISLHDVQSSGGEKVPIPDETIKAVVSTMIDFKQTCEDLGVPEANVQLIATEATRAAINSKAFLEAIESNTGWRARLLLQAEEARLGAMGIASSVNGAASGIVMDMGGGSLQMSLMAKSEKGSLRLRSLTSWPFGAAALQAVTSSPDVNFRSQFGKEIVDRFNEFMVENCLLKDMPQEGYGLYLSGGGFRGWGHIAIALDTTQPYPIPIVNGYQASFETLLKDLSSHDVTDMSHRVSKRRAQQVPGVELVLSRFCDVIKSQRIKISNVTFCQGGVREGILYEGLPESVRCNNVLEVATSSHGGSSTSALLDLLILALPSHRPHGKFLPSVIHLLYYHASYSKDIAAAAALRCTTTGNLASVHGLSHHERSILALILCERYGGRSDIPVSDRQFYDNLQDVIPDPVAIWWTKYIGRMAACIASLYPSGTVRQRAVSLECSEGLSPEDGETSEISLMVTVHESTALTRAQNLEKRIMGLGKKKEWVEGSEKRYGYRVNVLVANAFDQVSD